MLEYEEVMYLINNKYIDWINHYIDTHKPKLEIKSTHTPVLQCNA